MARETHATTEASGAEILRLPAETLRLPTDAPPEAPSPIQANGDEHRDLWRTRNHSIIRFWTESRGGHPAVVENGDGPSCVIRFPEMGTGSANGDARPISWGKFFEWFDEQRLVLEYELKDPSGRRSWFNRFVQRTPMDEI